MKKVSARDLKLVDSWDDSTVGREVSVRLDDGSLFRTRTRSAAWVLGGHTPVIMVEGISGAYSLARVSLVTPSVEGDA